MKNFLIKNGYDYRIWFWIAIVDIVQFILIILRSFSIVLWPWEVVLIPYISQWVVAMIIMLYAFLYKVVKR